MYELRVLALSEDARYVVLAPVLEGRRERYRVPVDERLRAALRGELGRLERKVRPDSALTPREIQARVRAGETAETIAAAAGVPVEWVLRFEAPVLAERGNVARQARASSLSVSGGEWTGVPLEEIVTARLEADGTKPDLAEWDSWRRDDGRWVLQLRVGTATAHWLWDPALQRLVVHDDAARGLLAARGPALPGSGPPAEPRRLSLAPPPASAGPEEFEPELVVELRSEADGAAQPPDPRAAAADRPSPDEYGLTGSPDPSPGGTASGSEQPDRAERAEAGELAADAGAEPGAERAEAGAERAEAAAEPADAGAEPDRAEPAEPAAEPDRPEPAEPAAELGEPGAERAEAAAQPAEPGAERAEAAAEPAEPAELAELAAEPAPQPAEPAELAAELGEAAAEEYPADPAERAGAAPDPAPAAGPEPDSAAVALALAAPELTGPPLASKADGAPGLEELTGTGDPVETALPRAPRRNRRKSVPSWEDILLGTGVGPAAGSGSSTAPPEAAR